MNWRSVQLKLGGKNLKIVVINGQGGCGKDTFIKLCQKHRSNIFSTSMVDGIKKIAIQMGWEGGKSLKDRKFLSDLKDISGKYNDFPFTYTKETVENLEKIFGKSDEELIVFVHAREPEDIRRWIEEYDAITLLIRRPVVEGNYGNHADDRVFDLFYDYTFWNDSTIDKLEERAKLFLKILLHENQE